MKRLFNLLFVIFIIIISYTIYIKIPRDYNIVYKVDTFKVEEMYNKSKKEFIIKIHDKNIKYPFLIENKFSKRKIIKKIKKTNKDQYNCIEITSIYNKDSLCSLNDQLYSMEFLNKKIEPNYSTKNNIKYVKSDKNIFLWNYNGFYLINNEVNNVKLNIEDSYEVKNILFHNDTIYLSKPDNDFYYKTIYTYNTKTNKQHKIKLQQNISYDSIFQGVVNNYLYVYDRRNDVQYKINTRNNSSSIVSNTKNGITVKMGRKWNKEHKVKDNLLIFDYYKGSYELRDNTLYKIIDGLLIKVSNQEIDNVIYNGKDEVYYISKGILYKNSPKIGEEKILEYSELNFNYLNTVYILE